MQSESEEEEEEKKKKKMKKKKMKKKKKKNSVLKPIIQVNLLISIFKMLINSQFSPLSLLFCVDLTTN